MPHGALSSTLRAEEKECPEETEACAQEATCGCRLRSEECVREPRAQATQMPPKAQIWWLPGQAELNSLCLYPQLSCQRFQSLLTAAYFHSIFWASLPFSELKFIFIIERIVPSINRYGV